MRTMRRLSVRISCDLKRTAMVRWLKVKCKLIEWRVVFYSTKAEVRFPQLIAM